MINFTIVNGFKYPEKRGETLTVDGYTLEIRNYEFAIIRKGVVLCIPFNEMLRVIDMYKKMGLKFPSAIEDSSFKQKAKKALYGGLEQLGLRSSSTSKKPYIKEVSPSQSSIRGFLSKLKEGFVNSPSRPSYKETLSKGLEAFGFKKRKK